MQERDAHFQHGHCRHNGHRMGPAERERHGNGGKERRRSPAAVGHGVHRGGRDEEQVAQHHHGIHGPGVPVEVPPEPAAAPVGEFGKGRINLIQG